MNIIAIDCGASFLKGALFEDEVLVKRSIRQAPKVNTADWREAKQISYLMNMVRSMLRELAQGKDEIMLCISNEMHGFILADRDGNPLGDYISWQREFGSIPMEDSGETAEQILSQKDFQADIRRTGMPLRAGLPNVNLLYICNSSDWNLKEKDMWFYTLGDYILRSLSQQEVCCHPTNAAGTGLMDLVAGDWNRKVCQFIGGQQIHFPGIGESIFEFEFEGIHVRALPALGDQQAALLGAGMHKMGDVSFNLGTGAQVSLLADSLQFSNDYQLRPYFGGKYLKTIPHLPSGRALNVYFRFVQSIVRNYKQEVDDADIWTWILHEVSIESKNNLHCDLSFFANPITDHEKGSITDIGEYDFTVGNLFRSLFRQMADNFLLAAEKLGCGKESVEKIVFSGGIARRIPLIREKILGHYSDDVSYSIGEDETLHGLVKYALQKLD